MRVDDFGDRHAEREHQELILAGRPVVWENTVRERLQSKLERQGWWGRISTVIDRHQFLESIGMPVEDYERGIGDPATQERMNGINARYESVKDAIHVGKDDLVLLVNGRHLIVGERFETLEQAFRTANLVIRQEAGG